MKLLALLALGVGAAAAPMGLAGRAPDIAALLAAGRGAPSSMWFTPHATEPATEEPPLLIHKERFDMPWVRGNGLRLRVTYLRTYGETRGAPEGFRVTIPGRPERLVQVPFTESLRAASPLYFAGEPVSYEIELRNDGSQALDGLWVFARQEIFQASGRGPTIGADPRPVRVDGLAPGESLILKIDFQLPSEPRDQDPIHFDQTHVSVLAGTGESYATLVDVPHAGIVDPPNFK